MLPTMLTSSPRSSPPSTTTSTPRTRARDARAHPEHQRRSRARRRRRVPAPTRSPTLMLDVRPRTTVRELARRRRASRTSSASGPHARRRADRAALRAPRRAAAGLRRPVVERPVRAPRERRPPVRPRHRRRQGGRGRAPRRGAGVAAHRGRAAVQREGAGGGRGGDRLARRSAPFLDAHADDARAPTCCSSPTPATGRWARPASPTRCAVSPASTCGCARSTARCTAAWPAAPCPIRCSALAKLLATLVDEHGDAAFDGCWDDYVPPDAAERARLAALPANADAPPRGVGRARRRAARRRPVDHVYERLWLRPVVTVIGIDGHPIAGSSNQIVARGRRHASACASVAGRTRPASTTRSAPTSSARVPRGLELTVTALDEVPAWHCDPTGWAFDAADRALRAGFGTDPVCMGVGGTIPFVGPFADAFGGIPALLLGPADPGSRIHGEDESLHLGDWHTLIGSEVRLLAELAATRHGNPRGPPVISTGARRPHHRHPPRAAPGRRPLRVGPVEGAPRGRARARRRRRHLARHQPPPARRAHGGRQHPRRARRPVRPARRLRGAARQRREHRVLGRRRVRPGRAARRAPRVRRVLRPSSPRSPRRAVPRRPGA